MKQFGKKQKRKKDKYLTYIKKKNVGRNKREESLVL